MKILDIAGLQYFWTKIKALLSGKADDGDVVHKAGDENVTGTKTFVGSKKIAFKQGAANDKLGFTLYSNSNVEKGYLEYNPTNQISGVPLMTLGNYATAAAGRAYVGFRKYSSISGAAGAYNLLTPLVSDARVPFNLTTSYTNFFLPLGVTDGTATVVTDKSGLLDISSLIPSTFASDAVTLLTGYSKPSTGSALAATDSLNQALGKLEVKVDTALDDSNYVHKTGNELITGLKVFHTNEPDFIGRNKVSRLVVKNDNVLKGTPPEHTIWSHLLFTDNSNNSYETADDVLTNRLGMLQYHVSPDISGIQIAAYKQSTEISEQNDKASLLVGYDENGIKYAQSPSTSGSRNDGQDILTRDWIPNDTRIVHTTGNESIYGSKYFYTTPRTMASYSRDSSINSGQYQTDAIYLYGSDSKLLANLVNTRYHASANVNRTGIRVWGADGHWADLNINRDDSGQVFVSMQSYESSSNFRIASQLSISDILNIKASDILQNNGNTSLAHFLLYSADINNKELASLFFHRDADGARNLLCLRMRGADNGWTDFFISRNDSGGYHCGVTGSSGTNAGWRGNADTATALATSRTIQTNLASTSSASFDGSANVTPGVTGILPVANGGTGSNTKNFVDLSSAQDVNGLKYFKGGMQVTNVLDINASNTCLTHIQLTGSSPSYADLRFVLGDQRNASTNPFSFAVIRANPSLAIDIGTRYGSETRWLYGSLLTLESATGNFKLTARAGESGTARLLIGYTNGTLSWNGQNIQVSSDERVKTKLSSVPDSVLDLWEDVEWGQFQYLDAVKEKGSSARLHVGLIAQQVIAAFGKKDFDACAYGILCHEVRDASPEVLDENGEVVTPAKDAVDLWMARYTEALCMEAVWQRRENARLKKRIADLEERLAALELKAS